MFRTRAKVTEVKLRGKKDILKQPGENTATGLHWTVNEQLEDHKDGNFIVQAT